MTLIEILLALSAVYCGGAYLLTYVRTYQRMRVSILTTAELAFAEANTFHLGLCFILSLGFLGVLVK